MVGTSTGIAYAKEIVSSDTKSDERACELTEAEHDVEENDQNHGDSLDEETGLAHPEWTGWHVFTTCQEMW